MKCTIFIADLHLSAQQPEIFALWQHFLQELLPQYQPDELYILGDFFSVWAGDDDLSAFNLQIIAMLKSVVDRGIVVYLLPGNRDFILGERFAKMSGCILLSDPVNIDLYGKPTVLTHGDILCTKDKAMNIFRFITRGNWFKKMFLLLPLLWRIKIAGLVHEISQNTRKGKGKPKNILEVDDQAVRKLLLKHQAWQIIHGHVHRADILSIPLTNEKKDAKRFVLDEWIDKRGNMLLYYEDGYCELKNFSAVTAAIQTTN